MAVKPTVQPGFSQRPLLSQEQLQRYSRQILLDEVGVEGQRRLLDSRVLLIGAGGLGSPAAIYLAAAGVGTIGIIDGDRVDLSNLHRQVIHFNHDVGRPKTQSAKRTLEDINPDVQVITYQTILSSENALDILSQFDVVINGCDNFATRYLVNDACVLLGKPMVDASILKWEGQATVFVPGQGCYRCLFPEPPPPGAVPSCAEGGIIGALAGYMGTRQAIEAVKLLLGVGEALVGRLVMYDALSGQTREFKWQRDPDCPICGEYPTITTLIDYDAFCGVPGHTPHGSQSLGVQSRSATEVAAVGYVNENGIPTVSSHEAMALLAANPAPDFVDVREPWEYAQVRAPGVRLIPMAEIPARISELDPDKVTLIICQSGGRSSRVTQWLRQQGFERVYNVAGGMIEWVNNQLPAERG